MIFKCISLDKEFQSGAGEEKVYTFSVYDDTVSFEGIKLQIQEVDDDGVSYRILEM